MPQGLSCKAQYYQSSPFQRRAPAGAIHYFIYSGALLKWTCGRVWSLSHGSECLRGTASDECGEEREVLCLDAWRDSYRRRISGVRKRSCLRTSTEERTSESQRVDVFALKGCCIIGFKLCVLNLNLLHDVTRLQYLRTYSTMLYNGIYVESCERQDYGWMRWWAELTCVMGRTGIQKSLKKCLVAGWDKKWVWDWPPRCIRALFWDTTTQSYWNL